MHHFDLILSSKNCAWNKEAWVSFCCCCVWLWFFLYLIFFSLLCAVLLIQFERFSFVASFDEVTMNAKVMCTIWWMNHETNESMSARTRSLERHFISIALCVCLWSALLWHHKNCIGTFCALRRPFSGGMMRKSHFNFFFFAVPLFNLRMQTVAIKHFHKMILFYFFL